MPFIKTGKIVVVLQGRFAGAKAVVLRVHASGHGDRKFPHVVVAGLIKPPGKVTKSMSKKKFNRRVGVIPFVKAMNLNHVMPTRYSLDIADKLKPLVNDETLNSDELRAPAMKQVKATLDERYKRVGEAKNSKALMGVQYFFQKLHF